MSEARGPARRGREPDALRQFDCLWCGQTWHPHDADDLEARARATAGRPWPPDLDRARKEDSARDSVGPETDVALAAEATHAIVSDDWYLRRGRHARGQVQDLVWQVDLDAATTWLDRLPIEGRVVELAAGTGWWSALLASKGELSALDAAPDSVPPRSRSIAPARDSWRIACAQTSTSAATG